MGPDRSLPLREGPYTATPIPQAVFETDDRRAAQRYRVTVRVEYPGGREHRRGTVYNIGSGGIMIRTSNPVEPGSELEMAIHVPGEGFVFAEGRVVWANLVEAPAMPAGMGVRFTRIAPEDRLKLESRLESL